MEIKIYKRYHKALLRNNITEQILATEKGKITPSKCPAIRQAYNLGCYVMSPSQYEFNQNSFLVKRFKLNDKILLDPGIIGDPKSNHFYARIDTGYSFKDLAVDVLATTILTPFMNNDYQIPPVVYPKNYTGPILAPVSSLKHISIEAGQPLLHLIPLGSDYIFEEIAMEISHKSFEGLFYNSILNQLEFIDEINCLEVINK